MSDAVKEGGDGPPVEQLTREQVMAQRAEKKKLKEARKNKSAAGAGDSTPKAASTPKTAPVPKAASTPKTAPVPKAASTPKTAPAPKATSTPKAAPAPAAKTTPAPKATSALSVASPSDVTSAVDVPKDNSPSKGKISVSVVNDSKSGTPDRTLSAPKTIEFQSTIQSLFKVKKGEVIKNSSFKLHPIFHNLGVKLRNHVVRGTNNRCITLLNSVKDYVRAFETPSGMSFKHALSEDLKNNMVTLRKTCPLAIGMDNAVEFLNVYLYNIEHDYQDTHQLKEEIMDVIDQYIEEKIEKAVEAIVMYGLEKIRTGDVIMIYSVTEALLNLLEKAAESGQSFELIILQTPETILDIPVLLKRLEEPIAEQTVRISTVNFSNAIYRIRYCTKLLIGGHGLFTTGGVMAQSGSGKLALLASTFNKPAIFLCETYKFCDRSPLDFFTLDEYMPEQSITEDELFAPKIKYDVTPANLVTVVITDIDMLPSTSVPVVLRVQEGRAPRKNEENSQNSQNSEP